MREIRRGTGWWLVAGALFVMQSGGQAQGRDVVTGPSQGEIPAPILLADAGGGGGAVDARSSPAGGGGGGGFDDPAEDDGARGPSPEAGTGGTSGGGGSRPAPLERRTSPIDSRPRDPNGYYPNAAQGGGGGGGGGGAPSNVVPVLRGNPTGPDSIHEEPSPEPPAGGGGGGGVPADWSPFIRVLPGGDAADWARSPSPGPR